jgi:hypothetical protein
MGEQISSFELKLGEDRSKPFCIDDLGIVKMRPIRRMNFVARVKGAKFIRRQALWPREFH